jgi:hypothetical protein
MLTGDIDLDQFNLRKAARYWLLADPGKADHRVSYENGRRHESRRPIHLGYSSTGFRLRGGLLPIERYRVQINDLTRMPERLF